MSEAPAAPAAFICSLLSGRSTPSSARSECAREPGSNRGRGRAANAAALAWAEEGSAVCSCAPRGGDCAREAGAETLWAAGKSPRVVAGSRRAAGCSGPTGSSVGRESCALSSSSNERYRVTVGSCCMTPCTAAGGGGGARAAEAAALPPPRVGTAAETLGVPGGEVLGDALGDALGEALGDGLGEVLGEGRAARWGDDRLPNVPRPIAPGRGEADRGRLSARAPPASCPLIAAGAVPLLPSTAGASGASGAADTSGTLAAAAALAAAALAAAAAAVPGTALGGGGRARRMRDTAPWNAHQY
eukprot:1963409-Prymnesium_polylepis.1